ncbi:TPA: hypothetical protein ACOQ33_006152 [Bacillus cereus]|uniref:hypothetical protein n=2 Tax=Bacillus cereus TaxID=1396 RepID=UPI001F17F416|nr:hypothetical protein [Bacillus cereus]
MSLIAMVTYLLLHLQIITQCPYEFAVEVAELMPNAIMSTFEYSNHFPFIEEEEEFIKFVESTVCHVNG